MRHVFFIRAHPSIKGVKKPIKINPKTKYLVFIFKWMRIMHIRSRAYLISIVFSAIYIQSIMNICDAIHEKVSTIQTIDFRISRDSISFWTDFLWGGIRNFWSTLSCKMRIIEKESLNAFGAVLISSIARRVNFYFWIVGPFSQIASHLFSGVIFMNFPRLQSRMRKCKKIRVTSFWWTITYHRMIETDEEHLHEDNFCGKFSIEIQQ